MKILYVITQGEQGGGQKYVLELAEQVAKTNEVFVAVGKMESQKDWWLFESLEKVGIKKENLFEIKTHQREINIWQDIKSIFEFVKLYKKIRPDVVHLNSSKAGFAGAVAGFCFNLGARLRRAPKLKTVYTVHGFVFLEPMNIFKKYFYICLEFISARLRNFTILITQKDIEAGKRVGVLGVNYNYSLIYNGVKDLREKMLSREEGRRYIYDKIGKGDEGQKIIGTISNLYKTKGLEYLIEAASKVRGDFLFIVLGFGPEKYQQELQNKINNLGLQNNFFLLGKTPDAYKYLKAFDVFTLTSVKEGLPYALLEAHMAGVPIVATGVGGIPEMAQHIKINLAETQNSQDIAGKILLEVEKQSLETELPEVYKLENCVAKTLGVYQKMLN